MVAKFSNNERNAIGIFLTDTCHRRDNQRKMEMLVDLFEKDELLVLIDRLVVQGSLTEEDGRYLRKKVEKAFV